MRPMTNKPTTRRAVRVDDAAAHASNAMTRRAIRVDDPTWDAADARAKGESRTVSDIVRIALRDYAEGRYDASPIRRKRQ